MTGVLLAELRVLDLCDGDADAVTRLFADLGADVLKVEPPGGNAGRSRRPMWPGQRSVRAEQRQQARLRARPRRRARPQRFLELAADADIVVDSGRTRPARDVRDIVCGVVRAISAPGRACRSPTSAPTARGHRGGHRPGVLCVVDGAVAIGPTAGRPVLPPDGIASATAAVQAAWAALTAYYRPITLRRRRLHRLLPLRGGRCRLWIRLSVPRGRPPSG